MGKALSRAISVLAFALLLPFAAAAQDGPVDGAIGFQAATTEIMRRLSNFHNIWLVAMCVGIVTIVLGLLLWIMIRYNSKANPKPASFSHNTLLEVVWTAFPVLILVGLAVPSFGLLYYEEVMPKQVDLTVKAIGNQWYWDYEYPDHGDFAFTSKMLPKEQADAAGKPYLLAVNEPMVVPVGKTVRVIITGSDVIHAWTIPSFGVKKDAVPGRLNEIWFKPEKEGIFYGQCSELCGADHAYMPIEVHVVSEARFAEWVAQKQKEAGIAPASATSVAEMKDLEN